MTGMIFKKLFNQALIVWDHCVYVRERLLWYDTEKAMPFLVRDTLARLHRAAAEVLYAEADLVTPCCATFNVNWEQWLGHAPETIMPVVNGLDFNQVKSMLLVTSVSVISARYVSCGTAVYSTLSTLCRRYLLPLSAFVCQMPDPPLSLLDNHNMCVRLLLYNCLSALCDVAVQDCRAGSC